MKNSLYIKGHLKPLVSDQTQIHIRLQNFTKNNSQISLIPLENFIRTNSIKEGAKSEDPDFFSDSNSKQEAQKIVSMHSVDFSQEDANSPHAKDLSDPSVEFKEEQGECFNSTAIFKPNEIFATSKSKSFQPLADSSRNDGA